MIPDLLRNQRGKTIPVHGQSAACRHPCGVRAGHNDRIQPAHLLLQQADRVVQAVRTQRVAADQFRKAAALMGRGASSGLHLMEHHRNSALCRLPGRFTARQPRANDL